MVIYLLFCLYELVSYDNSVQMILKCDFSVLVFFEFGAIINKISLVNFKSRDTLAYLITISILKIYLMGCKLTKNQID